MKIFRSTQPLFSGVQEGAVVLVAENFGHGEVSAVSRAEYSKASSMFRAIKSGHSSRARTVPERTTTGAVPEHNMLSDIITVRIGAVTGDGRYFLLSENRRRELELPTAALVPTISRASHLESAEVTRSQWERLRDAGDRVWLFRPSKACLHNQAVRRYLDLAADNGGCNRDALHVRRRGDNWFRVKLPKKPHGFVTGMGRFSPWISLNRDDAMTATNTLYAIRFNNDIDIATRSAWAMMLFTDVVQEQLEHVLRRYPDGLVKIEPGDFGRLRVPTPRRTTGALSAYRDAVESVKAGEMKRATRLATKFL
ncbi:MAG TPA: hypothetical protein VFP84_30915 [Kofleriaceae bacterium]|nr:hypothetical protein [Kofleriaceae bacterium]